MQATAKRLHMRYRHRELVPDFADYGVSLERFFVTNVARPRAQEGYTYQQECGFDVATEIAGNEAVGQFTNLGVGLGTMAGVGGMVAETVGGAMNDAINMANEKALVQNICAKCGVVLPENAKFCLNSALYVEKNFDGRWFHEEKRNADC